MWLTLTPVPPVGWWSTLFQMPQVETEGWSPHRGALAARDVNNSSDYYVGQPLVPHLTRDIIIDMASDFWSDKTELAARIFGEVDLPQ